MESREALALTVTWAVNTRRSARDAGHTRPQARESVHVTRPQAGHGRVVSGRAWPWVGMGLLYFFHLKTLY